MSIWVRVGDDDDGRRGAAVVLFFLGRPDNRGFLSLISSTAFCSRCRHSNVVTAFSEMVCSISSIAFSTDCASEHPKVGLTAMGAGGIGAVNVGRETVRRRGVRMAVEKWGDVCEGICWTVDDVALSCLRTIIFFRRSYLSRIPEIK